MELQFYGELHARSRAVAQKTSIGGLYVYVGAVAILGLKKWGTPAGPRKK